MIKQEISAEIISIGSEILLGHIINTNTSYLSRQLAGIGVNVFHHSAVGDNPARLSDTLRRALNRSDIVITSGGLGPTVDDITIDTIAKTVSRAPVMNRHVLIGVKKYFKGRGITMPAYAARQARVPEGALAIENTVGTAPASIIDYCDKTIVALPGPPRELIPIFENGVIPYLKKRYNLHSIIFARTIRMADLPESLVNAKIRRFLMMAGSVTVGIYARLGEVDVKITAKAKNKKEAVSQIKKVEKKILRILGDGVYGFGDETLESALARQLKKKRMTLAIAESCTGGLITNRITDIPGSSKYFDRGVVTYSNKSKIAELDIDKELIKKHGAVSRLAAIAMAKGLLKKSGSDIALAVTGIAGPAGGTKKKPVGLVHIAVAQPKGTKCIERHFAGSRTDIKHRASTAALELLRRELLLTTDDGRETKDAPDG